MNESGAKRTPVGQISARAKLRPKAQLTLPEEVRNALHVSEGDELEFIVKDDGTVSVRGYVSIPTDQVWLYSQRVAAGRAQASAELAGGLSTTHASGDAMFRYLDTLGPADD